MMSEDKPQAGEPDAFDNEDLASLPEEELRRRIEEHVRRQSVADVLVQFMASLSNLAYMKMGLTEDTQDIKDIEQARLAIDAFKALLDTAGERLEAQDQSALSGALASMQMTFVKAVSEESQAKPSGAKATASVKEAAPEPAAAPEPTETAESKDAAESTRSQGSAGSQESVGSQESAGSAESSEAPADPESGDGAAEPGSGPGGVTND